MLSEARWHSVAVSFGRYRVPGPQDWLVVHTRPRMELQAKHHLERQHFICLLPKLERRPPNGCATENRWQPLFPRYLFINCPQGWIHLAKVRLTRGVANLVHFGHQLAIASSEMISRLRKRLDPESQCLIPLVSNFYPGARVRIESGVFAGMNALFSQECGIQRAAVLISILGRETHVRVASETLRAA